LEGRLLRLEEKAGVLKSELDSAPAALDRYLEEWRRFSLESLEREIAWLKEMIITEEKSK
jgi:hypothetical protein